jgi:ketosteroid isomerase-like protein
MAGQLTAEEVRAAVQRFWDILAGKSSGKLEDFYSPGALVFTGKAKRSEAGRFVAVRRARQSSAADFTATCELDPIEIQLAGPDVAIATYTYRFNSARTGNAGGREARTTLFGRSTHIFQRDDKGALKIVHEHLSSAAPPKVEKGNGSAS